MSPTTFVTGASRLTLIPFRTRSHRLLDYHLFLLASSPLALNVLVVLVVLNVVELIVGLTIRLVSLRLFDRVPPKRLLATTLWLPVIVAVAVAQ